MKMRKRQTPKNSCGKKGCFISVRVLPYGEYDRRKYRKPIDRTVKSIRNLVYAPTGG